ncbi:MAG: tryptophan synthase subunit alpha, partial [Lachnospiraceae bacterium]|nr:tryptophan synthase subunit alpha [Lachnospiraceae bacterium]
ISMIAPTSEDRIKTIASQAKGFIYVVSSLGVTGVRSEITTDLDSIIKLIKESSDTPAAIGFGISTPEQALAMSKKADGVIVGSAMVRIVAEYGKDAPKKLSEYVKSMTKGL